MPIFKKLTLLSVIIVPIENKDLFLDLHYKKLTPNKVEISRTIEIKVDNSASPLFYKVDPPRKFKTLIFAGNVKIDKPLESEEKDSYFQMGVVYEGDYKPGSFVKNFLPEWLLKILSINDKYGVGNIDFHHVTNNKTLMDKKDSVRDINLSFKTITNLQSNGDFKGEINLRDKKILGLWLRSDGDDHKGSFKTNIKNIEFTE